tara:strand:- start:54 stop:488 length:435 start_codon:yes stop_codon:yes gene_type:complete
MSFQAFMKNKHHVLLSLLLIVFIVFDIQVPEGVAVFIDSIVGKALIVIIALALLSVNPIVGVLALITAYELIRRSSESSGNGPIYKYMPSDHKRDKELNLLNEQPYTVEEEVIANMLPRTATDTFDKTPEFKPVQENLHSAAKL